MNSRQFFTTHTWWGKVIGAFLGYIIAGPVGAFFGVLIGNFFDKGLFEHFSEPHWHYHAEKREAVQSTFFEATFKIMGHIAKADGRVSEHEIQMAKLLMEEMGLSHAQIKTAQNYFNEGKKPNFSLKLMLTTLREALHDNPELLKLFIDIQYRAAKVDGLSFKKQEALNTMLRALGFASLNQQYQFFEDFANYVRYRQQQSSSSQSHDYQKQYQRQASRSALDQAYAILDVPTSATKQEVKRAYRQLISRNHPDKLIAQGLPESMIKIANEKTQAITKAYEQVCESKGW